MAEYINREDVREMMRMEFDDDYADEAVDRLPAADVAPVRHGRWEWLGPNTLVKGCMCGTCSACKVRSKYIVNTGICPNCGARMDESSTQPQREDV